FVPTEPGVPASAANSGPDPTTSRRLGQLPSLRVLPLTRAVDTAAMSSAVPVQRVVGSATGPALAHAATGPARPRVADTVASWPVRALPTRVGPVDAPTTPEGAVVQRLPLAAPTAPPGLATAADDDLGHVGASAHVSAPGVLEPLDLPLGVSTSAPYAHQVQRTESPQEAETERLVEVHVPVPTPVAASAAPGDPAVQRVGGAADPAAPIGSSDEVDELARRLFDPLMLRLRAELLVDRERRGFRTDAW
ncbi:MAG TPA: hypothetical protein VHM65_07140, partial [Candidatus Lustribacter sp.]|nr:hypothetical protein [Candidatus Lustribacter sp.]